MKSEREIFIISEVHPQHGGSLCNLQAMILQSKLGGAHCVKVQLYDPIKLQGNNDRLYSQISFDELESIKAYCDKIEIDLFASVFDEERFEWCEELNFKYHKVAKRVNDNNLIEKMVKTEKPCFLSNDDFSWSKYKNVKYFYCIAEYPTPLENITMPQKFCVSRTEKYQGISDHSFGTAACLCAMSRGAAYIEKHFTLSKGMQRNLEKGHLGSMNLQDLQQIKQFSLDVKHII